MKTAKQELRDVLDRLPDDAPVNELLYEMYVRTSIAEGDEDARRGNVVSHEEVKERLRRWLASSGQTKLSGK